MARAEHHRSLDRLEAAINDRDRPYDDEQADRIEDASRAERQARSVHEAALGRKAPRGRQDDAGSRN